MSKTKSLAVAGLTLLGASMPLSALTIATRGLGQVLVFPYYTSNRGQNTLITLVNSTDRTKAVKARFRESYNGRVAVSFNIYLSPHDTWVGAVFALDGVVGVGSADTSCTAPTFVAGPPSMSLPIAPFSSVFYTNAYADNGPVDINRLLEGHFEFFEMGEVSSDAHGFQTDIAHVNGVPNDCAAIAAAWNTGVWATDGNVDMSPPTGGLYGSSAIVDVSNGTFFALPPTVIDGFSTTAQHTAPFENAPDFDTATAVNGSVAATVDVGGKLLQLHYTRSVDAVSALLMTTQQMNEYENDPSAGARTDWVSTFPTKHFYVDSLYIQSPDLSPFEEFFGARTAGESCVSFESSIFDRDEQTITPYSCPWECPPPPEPRKPFCHETSVVQLSSTGSALRTNATQVFDPNTIFSAGHLVFSFGGWQSQGLTASTEGTVLTGLPAIGFVAENFVNANVTAGVLANYSLAIPHRSTIACADGPCH